MGRRYLVVSAAVAVASHACTNDASDPLRPVDSGPTVEPCSHFLGGSSDAIEASGQDGCVAYSATFSPLDGVSVVDVCNRCAESRFIRLHGRQVGLRDRNAENFTTADSFVFHHAPLYGVRLSNPGTDRNFVPLCGWDAICGGPFDVPFEIVGGSSLTIMAPLGYESTPPPHSLDDRVDRVAAELGYDMNPVDYASTLEVQVGVPRLLVDANDMPAATIRTLCELAELTPDAFCEDAVDSERVAQDLMFLSVSEDEFPSWLTEVVGRRRAGQ